MTQHAPNRNPAGRVAVVVAAVETQSTALEQCLSRFSDEVQGRGEVVVIDGSPDGTAADLARKVFGIRAIRGRTGALVPELWRDGLNSTDSPLVAFSTAAMVPCRGWLDAMLARLDATGAVAVGGPIEPAETLSTIDRAVYLMRYGNYRSPFPESTVIEPPGDNAVYRRDSLTGMARVLDRGFWEAEVHRSLLARGERLAMAADAAVTFQCGGRPGITLGHRFRHGRQYGAMRSTETNRRAKLCRVLAAPAVPAVLLKRIAARLRGRGDDFASWMSALPVLSLLLTVWAAGEAWGTLAGPVRACGPVERPAIGVVRKRVRGGLS